MLSDTLEARPLYSCRPPRAPPHTGDTLVPFYSEAPGAVMEQEKEAGMAMVPFEGSFYLGH